MIITTILLMIGLMMFGGLLVYPYAQLKGYQKGLNTSNEIWKNALTESKQNVLDAEFIKE